MPRTGLPTIRGKAPTTSLVLELSEGRVVGAMAWPPVASGGTNGGAGWGPADGGGWRLGDQDQGRARARIEAPLDAKLMVRRGGQVVSVPVGALLERPQRTPATAALTVAVERLAWDSLGVELGPSVADGIVAPGGDLPVSVGFHILWPEATDVTVRYSAVLRPARGGEAVARREVQEVVAANAPQPPVRVVELRAPAAEGAYVLEVQAAWEPVAREGSRLGRLIRRRKTAPAATSCVRRTSIVVLDPTMRPAAAATAAVATAREGRRGEVDSVDLSRPKIHRPLASGRSPLAESGRSAWAVPAEALIEPSRRDRFRGWLLGTGAEVDLRLEPAGAAGLAWTAVGMKVSHPGRPHRLTVTVKDGEPAALGVALIDTGDARAGRARPRVLLDACASGPPVLPGGPPPSFSWVVWPSSEDPVLVLVNRHPDAAVRPGSLTLIELDDLPGPPPIREPDPSAARALGLYFDGPRALDAFGGEDGTTDAWTAATNLARYLAYCGGTAAVVSESLSDRPDRRALEGQAEEDVTRPDRLDILRRVLARQGGSLWLELSFDGPGALPGPAAARLARRRAPGAGPAGRAGRHRGLGLSSAPSGRPPGDAAPGRRGAVRGCGTGRPPGW